MGVCARCGAEGDEGLDIGYVWFCRECCRRGFACERCGRRVSAEDLRSGAAVATEDGKVYCPHCIELILPLFKALEDSSVAAPEVNPASSQMDAPPVQPASENLPAPVVVPVSEETRFSLRRPKHLLPIIAAVALVIVIIVVVAHSSHSTDERSQPPRPDRTALKKRRLLAKLQKRINQILRRCKGGPDFELARVSLEQLRNKVLAGKYPVEGLADINDALHEIRLMKERIAEKEYKRISAKIRMLEGQEKWQQAADTVNLFPSYLRDAGSFWQLLKKRQEQLLRLAGAKRIFLAIQQRVEERLRSPTADTVAALLEELKKVASQLSSTPYLPKIEQLIRRLQDVQRKLKGSRGSAPCKGQPYADSSERNAIGSGRRACGDEPRRGKRRDKEVFALRSCDAA